MYINFWYPIALSEEISADEPLRVQVLGLPFVAFRDDDGAAHVLADTCIHRGGSLSAGWVRGGRVVCPYHGWEFSGDGKCQHIPSLEGVKAPARAKVDAYPVQEKYGIVFAFLGDLPEEERPPLYEIEEYGNGEWKAQLYKLELNCYYQRSMENGLDPIHNEFVHPMQGAPMLPKEMQRELTPVEDIPWGSKFFMAYGDRKIQDTELAEFKEGDRVGAAGSWHQGPNQLVTWIDMTATNSFHQYLFEAPVDDSHTRIYFVNMRNFLLEDEYDQRIEGPTMRIVKEDVDILEKLNPIRTPETNTKELLLPSDHMGVRYREWLAEWDAKGWRIDFKAIQEKAGDVVYTIPCPARRESGNWVLDTVPLMPGGEAARKRRARPKAVDAA